MAQTGGQILFAFMLTLPFSARFDAVDQLDRVVYIVTLLAATASMALLIAPVSYHRQGRKPRLATTASTLAQAGLGALLIALSGALFLVIDVVAGLRWASALCAVNVIVYVWLWYVPPAVDSDGGQQT